jgi:hypothetical protein
VPTRSEHAEGHTVDAATARRRRTRHGRRPLACAETLCAEPVRPCIWPGEPSPGAHGEPVRGTTVRHGCRASDRFIVPRKLSTHGGLQGPAEEVAGRARAQGKAAVQTRDLTQGRVTPVTRARPRTAGPCGGRHVRPEAGARCGSAARRELCGGCRATVIPTATVQGICDKNADNPSAVGLAQIFCTRMKAMSRLKSTVARARKSVNTGWIARTSILKKPTPTICRHTIGGKSRKSSSNISNTLSNNGMSFSGGV